MVYETFNDWFMELEGHALRAERFYAQSGRAQSGLLWLQAAFDAGRSQVDAKQAMIDRLMQEFCPEAMTDEQWNEWMRHQKCID